MSIKSFPKALYKGDSINEPFQIKDKKTGELYEFQVGDVVRVGIKKDLTDEEYQIYKDFTITEPGNTIMINFTPEETDALTITEDKAYLEVRLLYNGGASYATVYQEKISLEGVVIDE